MITPEKPRSTAPVAPSTKYRDNFITILEKRWQEFDAATMREASSRNLFGIGGDTKTLRDDDADFKSAKATFEEAKSMLASIQSDNELKTFLKGPGRLSSSIASLEAYFTKLNAPEKAKEHNQVLANTLADLTALKAQVTEIPEDKRSAESARSNVANIPATPVDSGESTPDSMVPAIAGTVGGIGAAIVGTGLVTEAGWKKTLAEGFGKFRDWIASLFDGDSMLGSLLGGFKDKIMGIFGKIGEKLGIKSEMKEGDTPASADIITDASYISTVGIIRRFFLKDAGNAGEIYSYESFGSKTFGELETIYKNQKSDSLRTVFGVPQSSKITDEELGKALSCLVNPQDKKGVIFRKQVERTLNGADYTKLTMREIFGKLANPLSYLKALSSIDIVNNPTEMFDKFGFDIDSNGVATGDLAGKADILSPAAKKTLFISTFSSHRFTGSSAAMDSLLQTPEGKAMKETEKVEYQKIFTFGDNFRSKVLNNPQIHLGMRSSFEEVFDKKGLSFFGLASLYCMMDGKTDFESMTGIEKMAFYGGCATIMSGLDSYDKGKFTTTYLKKISSSSPDIPQEVKDVGTDFLAGIPQKAGSAVWEFLKTLGGAAVGAPEYALGGLVLWYTGGKLRKAHHRFVYHG